MRSAIRQRALDLGFDACGFTTAGAPSSAPRFRQWLASHQHGEMGYLERNAHKRVNPQQVLPDAKSIICLAASYHGSEPRVQGSEFGVQSSALTLPSASQSAPETGTATPASEPGTRNPELGTPNPEPGTRSPEPRTRNSEPGTQPGVVARYARYQDYHDVLGERLKQLTGFVNQIGGPGTRSLWYVDTGPLLERDLAQRAGLGFIGKHTNLISRRLGNWIFLAEILTTLELEPDTPEQNRCGTCTRCIEACPTHAITGPFRLDARLCISYLTIELKGPIPIGLRPAIGKRIYGCDDCLAVCPWNRFAREGRLLMEHARQDLDQPRLTELLALDEVEFRKRFADTPIWRTRRRGLLRNVCVALGNIGDSTALPALERAAQDPEPLIAEHARWASERIRKRSLVGPDKYQPVGDAGASEHALSQRPPAKPEA